jgi:hypothetical protein
MYIIADLLERALKIMKCRLDMVMLAAFEALIIAVLRYTNWAQFWRSCAIRLKTNQSCAFPRQNPGLIEW